MFQNIVIVLDLFKVFHESSTLSANFILLIIISVFCLFCLKAYGHYYYKSDIVRLLLRLTLGRMVTLAWRSCLARMSSSLRSWSTPGAMASLCNTQLSYLF